MARPKKLNVLKKTEKLENGSIVRNATKETMAKVRVVCAEYEKSPNIKDACAKVDWSSSMFYKVIGKYANAKECANKVGLGLRGDIEVRPAKVLAPEVPPDKSFTIFDFLGYKKHWTEDEKCKAIAMMLEKLAKGIPLAYACALSNISRKNLEEWCKEFPDLPERLQNGDAPLIEMMMGWLAEAGGVAAKQGKFGEILKGVEQRLPEKWSKPDQIDITLRREEEAKTFSLSAKDARNIDAFEIEEK